MTTLYKKPAWARGSVSVENPTQYAASYMDDAAALAARPERDEIFTLLMLLEVPVWMPGLWVERPGGWLNTKSGVSRTFQDLRDAISARITELALDPKLVEAYPASRCSFAEDQAFRRLGFDERMARFKQA